MVNFVHVLNEIMDVKSGPIVNVLQTQFNCWQEGNTTCILYSTTNFNYTIVVNIKIFGKANKDSYMGVFCWSCLLLIVK